MNRGEATLLVGLIKLMASFNPQDQATVPKHSVMVQFIVL